MNDGVFFLVRLLVIVDEVRFFSMRAVTAIVVGHSSSLKSRAYISLHSYLFGLSLLLLF